MKRKIMLTNYAKCDILCLLKKLLFEKNEGGIIQMKKKSTWKWLFVVIVILVVIGNAIPEGVDFSDWVKSVFLTETLETTSEDSIWVEECSDSSKSGCVRKLHVNGVEYSHFVQGLGKFSQHKFLWCGKTRTVEKAGCSFTSCASVASGYDPSITPERAFAVMDNKFSYNSDIQKCMKKLGISGTWYPDPDGKTPKECAKYFLAYSKEALLKGEPIIVLMSKKRAQENGAKTPDFWTSEAHFVAIVTMDEENIYTLDSHKNTRGYIYSEGLEEASLFMKGIWVPDEAPSANSVSKDNIEVDEKGEDKVSQNDSDNSVLSSLKEFFYPQNEENEEKKAEIKESETIHEIFLPPKEDTNFKSFMSWKTITDKSTKQYKLQHDGHAWTDEYGLRRYDDYYMIALGSYYAPEVGRIFRIVLEDNTEFTAIVGDQKADKDTDKYHRYRKVGKNVNVIEFIVSASKLPQNVRESGNISDLTMKDGKSFKAKVMYMELLNSPY